MTSVRPEVRQAAWASRVVSALRDVGVSQVVVSPGSRSTPMVVALAASDLACHVVIDERSAGFFALGMARESGRPVALLCTSGTAGAHYYPAIIEASESEIPLIALTADRPPELLGRAAAQTTDQRQLYGVHVRAHQSFEVPNDGVSTDDLALVLAASVGPRPGPVHLNLHFKKPLQCGPLNESETMYLREQQRSHGTAHKPRPAPSTSQLEIDKATAAIGESRRGLIVCGPGGLSMRAAREQITVLAQRTGYPILAEAASDVRFAADSYASCPAFDVALSNQDFAREYDAELCIEIGRPPISRHYAAYLARHPAIRRVVVSSTRDADPLANAHSLLNGPLTDSLDRIIEQLGSEPCADQRWRDAWLNAQQTISSAVTRELETFAGFHEGAAVRTLTEEAPTNALVMLGNSLPVRDMDTYCSPRARSFDVACQRGVAGIDGLVAGACGAAHISRRPVLAILGDVSFSHDIGSLALARNVSTPLCIAVLDNDGGRIFDQLPIASDPRGVELIARFFTTPPQLSVADACKAFGVQYACARNVQAARQTTARALSENRCCVVHLVVEPRSAQHTADALRTCLQSAS